MSLTIPTDCVPEVIEDLTALMLAGEASPGTRRFLAAHAGANPAFAARLEGAANLRFAVPPPPPACADEELQTLNRVRQFTLLRTIFTAAGIFFTLLPLSVRGGSAGVEFLFLGKQPGLVHAFWSIAVASWVACWIMHRQISKRGL
ncbi:MAG: hypothetical protein IH602_02905 [Bryobacteraceae bacterium]|nr:hypothetical protein [Bryobacteraceae bacterium]